MTHFPPAESPSTQASAAHGLLDGGAEAIASAVRQRQVTAVAVAEAALERVRSRNGLVNAVTRLLPERALADAARVDALLAGGGDPGALAGVPFAVKDLFDVAGLPTTAGSAMLEDADPAAEDALAIRRLNAAGAVLVGTCNMDEFAYGFATVNARHGTSRNPHDPDRLCGGSSGGSAAAVAAGMLPIALGSDTNGSIRVPASLCGLYGLKPTHGALPMEGVFPFVDSFDDIGPFAASLADLRLACSVMAGGRPGEGGAPDAPLRVAKLGGWFASSSDPDALAAIDAIGAALGEMPEVRLPHVDAARSAAFLMTAAEGGRRHLPELRRRAMAFDPATRDRLIAGAMLPVAAYLDAQDFRARFFAAAERLFVDYDVLVAPATPAVAPLIEDPTILIDGQPVSARANLGLYTQPLSFIGLPVLAVPIRRPGRLPLGLQLIGAPGREATLFSLAQKLDDMGLTGASLPALEV